MSLNGQSHVKRARPDEAAASPASSTTEPNYKELYEQAKREADKTHFIMKIVCDPIMRCLNDATGGTKPEEFESIVEDMNACINRAIDVYTQRQQAVNDQSTKLQDEISELEAVLASKRAKIAEIAASVDEHDKLVKQLESLRPASSSKQDIMQVGKRVKPLQMGAMYDLISKFRTDASSSSSAAV